MSNSTDRGGTEPRLTPDGAFVVQLRTDSDPPARRLCGRIEHVTSGQSEPFTCLDDLLAFITRHTTSRGPASG